MSIIKNSTVLMLMLFGQQLLGQLSIGSIRNALLSSKSYDFTYFGESNRPDIILDTISGHMMLQGDSLIYDVQNEFSDIESMTSDSISISINHTVKYIDFRIFGDDTTFFWAPPNFHRIIDFALVFEDSSYSYMSSELKVFLKENKRGIESITFHVEDRIEISMVIKNESKEEKDWYWLFPRKYSNPKFPSIEVIGTDSLVLPDMLKEYSYRVHWH